MKTIIETETGDKSGVVAWVDGNLSGTEELLELLNEANRLLEQVGPVGGPYTKKGNHLKSALSVVLILGRYTDRITVSGDIPSTYKAPKGAVN